MLHISFDHVICKYLFGFVAAPLVFPTISLSRSSIHIIGNNDNKHTKHTHTHTHIQKKMNKITFSYPSGQPPSISCTCSHIYIKYTIFCFHFTLVLYAEGPTLPIARVDRTHMGSFLCIASNGVPPSVSKRITLIVHCKYHWLSQCSQTSANTNNTHMHAVRCGECKIVPSVEFVCLHSKCIHNITHLFIIYPHFSIIFYCSKLLFRSWTNIFICDFLCVLCTVHVCVCVYLFALWAYLWLCENGWMEMTVGWRKRVESVVNQQMIECIGLCSVGVHRLVKQRIND